MKRLLLSVGSTALSGLSNVIVQVVAAALLSATEFAEFSIIAATILFALGGARSVVAQTDMLRGRSDSHHGPADAALAIALLILGLSGVAFSIALLTQVPVIVAVGIGLVLAPAFVLQDSARFRAFRLFRPGVALVSDATVLLITVAFMLAAAPLGQTAGLLAIGWTIATVLGLIVLSIPLRIMPTSPRAGLRWVIEHRDLIGPGFGEYVLQSGLPYALNFVVLSVGGVDALAGYRLVQLIFAALGNVAAGLNAATVPKLVHSRDPRYAMLASRLELIALSALSGVIFATLAFVPAETGQAVFGETWTAMMPFLLVGAVHGWANSVAVPNYSLLRLLGYARLSFWIRIGSVIVTIVAAIFASFLQDAVAVAWAIAIPSCAALAIRYSISTAALHRLRSRGELIP